MRRNNTSKSFSWLNRFAAVLIVLMLAFGSASANPADREGESKKRIALTSKISPILLEIEVDSSEIQQAVANDGNKILLKSRQFIPPRGINKTTIEKIKAKAPKLERTHILLQLEHIPNKAERKTLKEKGVKLLSYIPNKAWFVSIPSLEPEEVATLTIVRGIDEILPEDKISPAVRNKNYIKNGDGKINLSIMFFEDVNLDNASSIMKNYGEVVDRFYSVNSVKIVTVDSFISDIANEEIVQWINVVDKILQIHNDGSRENVGVNILQSTPYSLSGTGVVTSEWDGGWADTTHDDLQGRVTVGDAGCTETNCNTGDHATHVAGTMLGNGALSAANGGTALQWRGIAPNATVISYEWWDTSTELNNEYGAAINIYNASLSQNSWGYTYRGCGNDCSGGYDSSAAELDGIIRGSKGKKISQIWSAGNERPSDCDSGSYDCIGVPGTAKNAITVGATNSDDDSMTSFSSWGPTNDGRLKPEVTAPGCQAGGEGFIKSTLPGDTYGGPGWCGTSMAAPATSGVVALMLEEFNNKGVYPLPSTIKAILIHTAKDLSNTGPDYSFGYGRINATASIEVITDDTGVNDIIKEKDISDGESDEFNMTVPQGAFSVKVTLVWDDYPATANADPTLVNHLDIVLIAPNGAVYRPWVLDPNNPGNAATTGTNNIDNVEQVFVISPQGGIWRVQVNGSTVPQGPQNYSLVSDFSFSIIPTVAVEIFKDSGYSREPKFFNIGEIVYVQANITAGGEPITGAIATANLTLSNGTLEESISLTEIGIGTYRNSWNSSNHNVGVYFIDVGVSGGVTGDGQSYFHLFSGSGVSAYNLDWNGDGGDDYVLENKHLISVFDGGEYTDQALLYLYQKDTMVNYTFGSISDADSIGRGEITTSSMTDIEFYSFYLQEGENIASGYLSMITNLTKTGSLVEQEKELFSDGFESGDFIAGGWSLDSPPPDIGTEDVYEGTYSAGKKVYGGYGGNYHRMWGTVDTTDCTNITFGYARAVEDAGAGTVDFTAEYSTDGGTTWIELETVTDTNDVFTYVNWPLPTEAEDNSNFVIGFSGLFGGGTSNGANDWEVDAVNVTGICLERMSLQSQLNITVDMRSEDADYLVYKLHDFDQNISDINDIFSDITGSIGPSVNDDRYHLDDGSDDLVTSLTTNKWNDYNSNYTIIYDNSTASDSVNDSVVAWIRFNETENTSFQDVGIWNDSQQKEGLRIRYNTSDIAQSDEIYYLLAFTKGDWQTIEQWLLTITQGQFPDPNFMNEILILDTTSPQITIDYPTNTTYSTNDMWFNATIIDVTDGVIDTALVQVDGVNYTLTNSSGNYNYQNTTGLPDGNYNARFYANDTSGNLNSSTVYFTIETNYNISLIPGWNMISIPLEQKNWSITSVLASIEGNYTDIYAYVNGMWYWDTSLLPFFKLTDMAIENGYWINMSTAETLELSGTVPSSTTISVVPKWNLVGYPTFATQNITTVLPSIGYTDVYTYKSGMWYWDTSLLPFFVLTEMTTGQGYWINATGTGSYGV